MKQEKKIQNIKSEIPHKYNVSPLNKTLKGSHTNPVWTQNQRTNGRIPQVGSEKKDAVGGLFRVTHPSTT